MPTECLTEDLLKRLLNASSPEVYLDHESLIDRTLPAYLYELLDERGIKRAEVVRASGLHPTVVYDIFGGKSLPGRDHAIMLAFGLGCSVKEAQRVLRLAGVAELWPKIRRDAIIIWCIKEGLSRQECDDKLWEFSEKTLFGTGRLR